MIGQPLNADERALIDAFRDNAETDRRLLSLTMAGWARLSPAQRQAIYRLVDLFVSAQAWRRPVTEAEKGGA